MNNNTAYKNALKVGAVLGTMALYPACNNKPQEIKAEGFPKGYHIENVDIKTRGNIIRVEILPGENYQVEKKDGYITFKGNFEYEIKPLRNAMPKDAEHTDMEGNTPFGKDGHKYWEKKKQGTVTLHKNDSIDSKL
jgi:hypothetical protein